MRTSHLLVLAALVAPTRAVAKPVVGVMTDVGAPDGANVALVVRPMAALRLHAGGGHNSISPSVRGGVTLSPLATWIRPTLSADVGRQFEGDANPLVRMVTGDETFSSPLLDRIGYDYAAARLGVELGRDRFTFFIHAGFTHIRGDVHGLALPDASDEMSNTQINFTTTPTLELTTLSARLGFILYLK